MVKLNKNKLQIKSNEIVLHLNIFLYLYLSSKKLLKYVK